MKKLDGDYISFDPSQMWEDYTIEIEDTVVSIKTPVINLKNTFYGTKQCRITKPFLIKSVMLMNYTFYNCMYDSPEEPYEKPDPSGL